MLLKVLHCLLLEVLSIIGIDHYIVVLCLKITYVPGGDNMNLARFLNYNPMQLLLTFCKVNFYLFNISFCSLMPIRFFKPCLELPNGLFETSP